MPKPHFHKITTISLLISPKICAIIAYMVGLAQMVRASDCGPEGRRFDPDIPPQVYVRKLRV